ncbi:MAG: hypothetical protein M1837_003013 [Sclerophora amabilis]|nr:MAG: hypothetical protein M1837_003013 [Sclerophora amabilis]
MPVPRRLLHGDITYLDAKTADANILHQLTYTAAQRNFFISLGHQRRQIEAVVSRHLGLSKAEKCSVSHMSDWITGSFNVVIPVSINGWRKRPGRRVLVRFPLPYKIGEAFRPGNSDEKLRCEAATYAWLSENSPDVPIPRLWGFGLSDGHAFTILENTPLLTRCLEYIRRCLRSLFGYSLPSRYIRYPASHELEAGYLLTDFIEERDGTMLSRTWEEGRQDTQLRANLFRDISRIILSIGRVPQPRIGSFTINNDGFLSLTNRPLSLQLHQLENDCIPIALSRELTYPTTRSYVIDLLDLHRSRLRHQPNAAHSIDDCLDQIASMSVMESVYSNFFSSDLRGGPFTLTLTDLHFSNIFVDEDWHITGLVDLEWACVRPIEMQHPPPWFTSHTVDEIDPAAYDEIREEFMNIFRDEESILHPSKTNPLRRADVMQHGWENGNFWYCHALDSPTGLYHLLYRHIQPLFLKTDREDAAFYQIMSRYWVRDVQKFMDVKVKDHEEYLVQLRKAFDIPEDHLSGDSN